jgi:hypothetical protein
MLSLHSHALFVVVVVVIIIVIVIVIVVVVFSSSVCVALFCFVVVDGIISPAPASLHHRAAERGCGRESDAGGILAAIDDQRRGGTPLTADDVLISRG